MALSLAGLKIELQTDPNAYGYAATGGDEAAKAALLNQVRAQISISRGIVPAREVVEATVAAEWASLSAAEKQRYQTITGAGEVNTEAANIQAAFLAMFAGGTATRTALIALATRSGSRAEQLFGVGVVVSHQDIAAALSLP